MEEYFKSRIQKDIVYFDEIRQVLQFNEDDFRDRFEYIIGTIKGAILAIDGSEKLTPAKINLIFVDFYKTDWDWHKKLKAERLNSLYVFLLFS